VPHHDTPTTPHTLPPTHSNSLGLAYLLPPRLSAICPPSLAPPQRAADARAPNNKRSSDRKSNHYLPSVNQSQAHHHLTLRGTRYLRHPSPGAWRLFGINSRRRREFLAGTVLCPLAEKYPPFCASRSPQCSRRSSGHSSTGGSVACCPLSLLHHTHVSLCLSLAAEASRAPRLPPPQPRSFHPLGVVVLVSGRLLSSIVSIVRERDPSSSWRSFRFSISCRPRDRVRCPHGQRHIHTHGLTLDLSILMPVHR